MKITCSESLPTKMISLSKSRIALVPVSVLIKKTAEFNC